MKAIEVSEASTLILDDADSILDKVALVGGVIKEFGSDNREKQVILAANHWTKGDLTTKNSRFVFKCPF